MTQRRHAFDLWQNGMIVASVDAPDRATALREIMHYAMMYTQDGPCEVKMAYGDGETRHAEEK